MNARSSKSKHCQALLLEIFPRIVTINKISDHQLNEFVEHTLNSTSKYPQAFLSFGLLSLNQPREIAPKVPKYFSILAQQLKECVQKKREIHKLLFKSLRLIVRSQKDGVYEEIQRMLPLLLATGLSEGLTEVFEETVTCIPALKTDVLDGLMEQLYQLLMNRQLPSKLAPPALPPIPNGPIQVANIDLTKLALKTLGSFEFQRHTLQMFIRYIALGYLTSNEVVIQLAAVDCCVSIVKPFIRVYDEVEDSKKSEVYLLIRSVLDSLINVAITDSRVEVRLCVLESFRNVDHDFLVHLAQQDTLDRIFMILNDEKYKMQEAAAGLLAQLSELNPALILPKLRKLLNEQIYNLATSRVPKLEEHGARIIINLAIHVSQVCYYIYVRI
jgi:FKBP12-rapamycin complex-associated protein